MLESKRQTKIKNKLEADGWTVVKLIKTSMNGIPDLMCLKNGVTMFVEVKQPNGVLSEIQKYRIKELQSKGFIVYVWIDYQTTHHLK